MSEQTLTTADEIRQAISDPDLSVVLLDSGGFVWWRDELDDEFVLSGVATRAQVGSRGLSVQAFMNIMTPEEAEPYGPFTVIHRASS